MNWVGVRRMRVGAVRLEGFEKSNRLVGKYPVKDRKLARWLSVNVVWIAGDIRLRYLCIKIGFKVFERERPDARLFYCCDLLQ